MSQNANVDEYILGIRHTSVIPSHGLLLIDIFILVEVII